MSVRIEAAVYITGSGRGVHSEEDLARAERESMETEARPIPATKSSINALERVFRGQ
ncbi:hypothetical protein NC651_012758 [Populus alba x Populus x berolinensis]|nr:hypothetical protein NC651_012758 [Populus alba x Populus x berolinensis]